MAGGMASPGFTVGVVGLGLIGGSLAKAVKGRTSCRLLGMDRAPRVMEAALREGTADGPLTPETVGECRLVYIALYPAATVAWLKENAGRIPPDTVVVDCCGVKECLWEPCRSLARAHGFVYIGGHPMAGAAQVGYGASREDLFDGAAMIIAPGDAPRWAVERVEAMSRSLGFGSVTVTTPREHDRIIAFTSQLAHVLSNAYVKSPQAMKHTGFSAGSFRDLTRVAWLNEEMWTQLFLDNRECLAEEIDGLAERLKEYSAALKAGDGPALKALLREGRERKEGVDRL